MVKTIEDFRLQSYHNNLILQLATTFLKLFLKAYVQYFQQLQLFFSEHFTFLATM